MPMTPLTGTPKSNGNCWSPWRPASRQNLRAAAMKGGVAQMPPAARALVRQSPFLLTARDTQAPPPGDWRTWLFLGGRGAGKTRAGAEWVRFAALRAGYGRIALVGPALHDVREVMIGEPSGLIAISGREGPPRYESSRRRLLFANGAVAYAFSAEDADSLRGPQFDAAWCDEAAAWPRGEAVWDTLQMGLRIGPAPRAVVTTTPRPVALIKRLCADPDTVKTASTMAENAAHLSPHFVDAMQRAYGGSRMARQELSGELMQDPEGALFARAAIDAARVSAPPALFEDIIVAIDPPTTSTAHADACGIIAAGLKHDAAFILGDASAPGLKPLEWARRAVALAHSVGATRLIAEANQGGEMIRQTLETAGAGIPVVLTHARLDKRGRAMPVATLYQQGRVHHVGSLALLEDQMCTFGAPGFPGSPDRVDALVWAVTTLLLDRAAPGLRGLL
jgi:phage terminase large subunit-like protein